MAVSLRANVAHIVAGVLARRATPQHEIPLLMQTVEAALMALDQPPQIIVEEAAPVLVPEAPPPRARRPRRAPVLISEPALPVPQTPQQPRLVRRADAAPAPPRSEETAPLPQAAPRGALRGIVKWFDQRARRGALRLPGCAEDVVVEAPLLDDMAITRLYKGQEIEAVLAADAPPRVAQLAIPGGVWQVQPTGGLVRNRNHARPVVVELKREALRRVAARVEAEQLLGPTRAR